MPGLIPVMVRTPGPDTSAQNEAALEAYAESPGMRSMVASLPGIGGPLDVFLEARARRITEERLRRAVRALEDRLRKIESGRIDLEALPEGNLFDAVIAYFETSARIDDELQQHIAAQILTGALLVDGSPGISPQQALRLASELTPFQIQILTAIHSRQSVDREPGENDLQVAQRTGWSDIPRELGISGAELRGQCEIIVTSGLLREVTGAFLGYGGGVYVGTASLDALVGYLTAGLGLDKSSAPGDSKHD